MTDEKLNDISKAKQLAMKIAANVQQALTMYQALTVISTLHELTHFLQQSYGVGTIIMLI